MKIRCDVCDKVEATVFCCADEAALCDGCDHRVHHANMLASKHSRFSLVHPSFKESPLCDICQVRRAVLFCQEDRAILCRECDLPIHKVSEHTQKHNRFLLTGVKLSGHSQNTASSSTGNCDANIGTTSNRNHQPYLKKPSSASNEIFSSSSVETASPPAAFSYVDNHVSGDGSISTSSISEYLETVPGWNVDDFLDPSFSGNNSFGKGWNAPNF
uniref:B box-type domain-containing protein n=2 Tax=Salix TaxID=40685 RepID=A0A6N2L642_SALVM